MDITVILRRPPPLPKRGARHVAPSISSLDGILKRHEATLVPLHPGVESPELASHYALRLPPGADAQRVLDELRDHEAVEAAYVKPAGEAPA